MSGVLDERSAVLEAFDVSTLHSATQVALERLSAHLLDDSVRGVRLQAPDDLVARARALMTASDPALDANRFGAVLDLYLDTAIHLRSRGYLARQFSSVVPLAAVMDLVTAVAPQPGSFYEAGQLANVADKLIAAEFGALLGWEPGAFDMVSTSGGALANLTAILAARNVRRPHTWQHGTGGTRLAIAMGEDAHYSVERVAGIIGIGTDSIVRLPLDAQRRIDIAGAEAALDEARARGLDVFCIIGVAGSTSTGSIDPLGPLADLARRHGAWLHIDACHGGALLVSDQLRPALSGLERADSFCLDAHKTLFVPAACTLLFYRDAANAPRAFTQDASYVFDDPDAAHVQFESATKNLECTKRPAIVALWAVWALYGPEVLAEKLERLVRLTADAHALIDAQPDFRCLHEPEVNILCFEYAPDGLDPDLASGLHTRIRDTIRQEGRFLITRTSIDDRIVLRLVLMNHELELDDIRALLLEVRRIGQQLLGGVAS